MVLNPCEIKFYPLLSHLFHMSQFTFSFVQSQRCLPATWFTEKINKKHSTKNTRYGFHDLLFLLLHIYSDFRLFSIGVCRGHRFIFAIHNMNKFCLIPPLTFIFITSLKYIIKLETHERYIKCLWITNMWCHIKKLKHTLWHAPWNDP